MTDYTPEQKARIHDEYEKEESLRLMREQRDREITGSTSPNRKQRRIAAALMRKHGQPR